MPRSGSRRSYSRSQSRSKSRSRSRSRTRSRSNSRGRNGGGGGGGRDNGRDNGRDRYNDNSSYNDLCRVHIADLTEKVSKSDIEKAMGKFGDIEEVWMAKNPPCFAFVVYKNKDDASDAIRDMDGRNIAGYRVRVTQARPRVRRNGGGGDRGGNRPRRFDTSMRCYQCGQRGHLSRECDEYSSSNKKSNSSRRRYSRSGSRDRGDRGGRYRSRSKSNSRHHSRSRSRDNRSNSPAAAPAKVVRKNSGESANGNEVAAKY